MNIELYIEHRLVELSDKINYSLNKQFEDINDPTTIINDWSKTINVPGTEANNILFGQIFNAGQMIVGGGKIGVKFDPTRKLEMDLQYNGCLVLHGYAKLNSITRKSGKIQYNLTLNGQLGALFQQYKLLTFNKIALEDPTTTDNYIDTTPYYSKTMNKDLVYEAWNNTDYHVLDLDEAVAAGAHTSIIGFTPNESLSDDFDSKTIEVDKDGTEQTVSLVDELKESEAFAQTGIDAESAVGDGLTPRGIGDFRSYNQIPYLYINKLFQIFQKKAEDVSGYKWVYDERWFSDANPYWTDLVMQLKTMQSGETTSAPSRHKQSESIQYVDNYSYSMFSGTNKPYTPDIFQDKTREFQFDIKEDSNYLQLGEDGYFKVGRKPDIFLQMRDLHVNFYTEVSGNPHHMTRYTVTAYVKMDNRVAIQGSLKFVGRSGNVLFEHKFMICSDDCVLSREGFDQVFEHPQVSFSNTSRTRKCFFEIRREAGFAVSEDFKIELTYKMVSNHSEDERIYPWYETTQNFRGYRVLNPLNMYINDATMSVNAIGGYNRSNTKADLTSFWDMDYEPFDQILRYCKTFGILIMVDEATKTVNFIQRTNYFADYEIVDWTGKVDYSKDFTINPVNASEKYMKFQYEDSDLLFNEYYKRDTGYNYGEFRLKTGYDFNEGTKDIMPKSNFPLVFTDTMFMYDNLKSGNVSYISPSEEYIGCKDKDGKYVSQFGAWYIKTERSVTGFDFTNTYLVPKITDDTPTMASAQTFTYYGGSDARYSRTTLNYSRLSLTTEKQTPMFDGKCLTTYALPSRSYTYVSNIQNDALSIYDIVWGRWLAERLNIQNKMITCYVNLTPIDYKTFEFRRFVKIDGIVYMVNKIYDYDITSNKPTKVDLLQVTDITAYTKLPHINNNLLIQSENMGYQQGNLTEPDKWYSANRFYSYLDTAFTNGQKEITIGGLLFKIVPDKVRMLDGTVYNYSIEYQRVERYMGDDVEYSVGITNGETTSEFAFTRYHDLPNPPTISISQNTISGASGEFYIEVQTQNGIDVCVIAERRATDIPIVHSDEETETEDGGSGAPGRNPITDGDLQKLGKITFTVDPWEEHNDDYHYWGTTVHYTSTITDTLPRTISIGIVTGAGYRFGEYITYQN